YHNPLAPTTIHTLSLHDALPISSQEQQNITAKVLSNASGPLLRYDVSATPGQPYAISAGGQVRYYYNPYTGGGMEAGGGDMIPVDRKSTRLNSSHRTISYAVFCL